MGGGANGSSKRNDGAGSQSEEEVLDVDAERI
jgi:hypothetical protein